MSLFDYGEEYVLRWWVGQYYEIKGSTGDAARQYWYLL